MKIGRLLLRLVMGGLFVGHGTQKLFGWFGGHGLDATAKAFEQMGMRPGRRNAIAAGAAEVGGGGLLALGLATPLAGSVLIATMITAIERVHASKGPWATDGGYEYNLVLIAAALALAEAGPGAVSLDAARGREYTGSGWALAALGAGALGSYGAHAMAQAAPLPPASAPAPSEQAANLDASAAQTEQTLDVEAAG